jgi:hypothetical protein
MREQIVLQGVGAPSGLVERDCPTCGRPCPPGRPAVASRRRAEDLRPEERLSYWHHFFKEKVFFSYCRCPGCGLLYCPRYFDDDTLGKLYGQTQHDMVGVPVAALRRTQRGYFRTLQAHSPLRGTVLEVGPDVGLFTDFCVRKGRFDRFVLFEPSRSAHGPLAQRLAGRDFVIHPQMFAADEVPERGVSAAVLIHVVDHLTDPRAALEGLRSRLADDAVVLIVTHDEASLMARVLRSKWPPYCLLHPQLYSPASMRAFLESAGYRVREISKTSNHFPATYLLKHLLCAAGARRLPVPQLPGLQLALKLGNIITVASPRR